MGWQEPAKPGTRAGVKGCHSCNGRTEVNTGCRVSAWADLGAELNPGVGSVTGTSCGSATELKGIVSVGSEDLATKCVWFGCLSCWWQLLSNHGSGWKCWDRKEKAMVFPLKNKSEDLTMVSQPLGPADQFFSRKTVCYPALAFGVTNHSKCN